MDQTNEIKSDNKINQPGRNSSWMVWIILLGILMMGAYFRFIGINWGEQQHLHPDERFLTMVETSISPVKSIAEYFNTEQSSLNPNNRGYGFYVYGTLPLFLVRYVAEWIGQTGYDQVDIVGRSISALLDVLTALWVFLITKRLFRNSRMALLAAAFYSLAVLPIQLSHYFTVDTYANFFAFATFYAAVVVLTQEVAPIASKTTSIQQETGGASEAAENPGLMQYVRMALPEMLPYVGFGIALGMAMASKVSVAPLALLLPGAALIRYLKMSGEEQEQHQITIWINLVAAAIVSFVVFRIFQPFAFRGPGFFGIIPNEKWISGLKELSLQSKGDVDFPPALQWSRRPITFAFTNLVKYGLGLPLGITAWIGFVWMGFEILKKKKLDELLIWGWTGVYFAWQSINFTRSMRYQLPVYPTLCILAAWLVFALWRVSQSQKANEFWRKVLKALPIAIGTLVLISTFVWAAAFVQIYKRPITRVEASRWIYQNVPAAINLQYETATGKTNQPLAFRLGASIDSTQPLVMVAPSNLDGVLTEFRIAHVVDTSAWGEFKTLELNVTELSEEGSSSTAAVLTGEFKAQDDPRGSEAVILLEQPFFIKKGYSYRFSVNVKEPGYTLNLAGSVLAMVQTDGQLVPLVLAEPVEAVRPERAFQTAFQPTTNGKLTSIFLPHVVDWEGTAENKTLLLTISDPAQANQPLAKVELHEPFRAISDARGESYTVELPQPVELKAGTNYQLHIELVGDSGAIALYGSRHANESSWDDPLPLSLQGYNPYDYYTGVFRTDLNFEMYWDDNADKLTRFTNTLDQADYIFISSNRQWGTTVRVPERYPLTSTYYRNLIGCPEDKDIFWCYSVAAPGMFTGELGFELVKVQQSDPSFGPFRVNTQFAEEAFTVYDHPKVLIFKKSADYDSSSVRKILGAVDLTHVVHLTPGQAKSYPGDLMLPTDRLSVQREGGTWSELFHTQSIINKAPWVGAIAWYVVVLLLGWMVYPLVRMALRGLTDHGYPLARTVGMVVLGYLVWLGGSFNIPVTRGMITVVILLLAAVNAVLFFLQRDEILQETRSRSRYILWVEVIALALFLFDLAIRIGNPDIWHPYKGGEKPMDFSYFNAVIKSSTFPPYDPWFAGGYINYYYYGYVLVGVLVKWLGIVPSIAYNLILPTLFSMLGLGAFCIGWNLYKAVRPDQTGNVDGAVDEVANPWYAGLASILGLQVLGNLGTVRMIWHGIQKLVAPGTGFEQANPLQHWAWFFQGLVRLLSGAMLPYGKGEWYWIPSRAFPEEPITEFPFFTFLYADLHAHMIALPLTVLAIAWALSIVLGRWQWGGQNGKWRSVHYGCSLLLGGLTIGALKPTNTWDLPTYLALGIVAILYAAMKNDGAGASVKTSLVQNRWLAGVGSALLLSALAFAFYQPFSHWFGQGYNAIEYWKGSHTPFWSYFTHWGLFLFVIFSWLAWETIDWMAKTPVSALNKLLPYKSWLTGLAVLFAACVIGLLILGVRVAWLVLPMALWAGILLFRPGQNDAKRAALFMVGSGLVLTLAVELIVLRGDIGRMNTVFKFSLQAWTLLSISGAAGLMWMLPAVFNEWNTNQRSLWAAVFGALVFSAALFPVIGGMDKITDRMSDVAPHSLDGMMYMTTSSYFDNEKQMSLVQDYEAIRWMQENVEGSPVIVEGNTPEYRWGSRYTIYTGLPGVVGWNWHQRQQRTIVPSEWITNRVNDIQDFYNTTDPKTAAAFLDKYQVKYIVVGQLEQAFYEAIGLSKFESWDGTLWKEVYRKADTAIYETIQTDIPLY